MHLAINALSSTGGGFSFLLVLKGRLGGSVG